MKKQAYMIATMIVLMTVAGLYTARAQTSGTTQLTTNIPFDFSVGNQTCRPVSTPSAALIQLPT